MNSKCPAFYDMVLGKLGIQSAQVIDWCPLPRSGAPSSTSTAPIRPAEPGAKARGALKGFGYAYEAG